MQKEIWIKVGAFVQPMDQPELARKVVAVRWSAMDEAYRVSLEGLDFEYHQDELERAE